MYHQKKIHDLRKSSSSDSVDDMQEIPVLAKRLKQLQEDKVKAQLELERIEREQNRTVNDIAKALDALNEEIKHHPKTYEDVEFLRDEPFEDPASFRFSSCSK